MTKDQPTESGDTSILIEVLVDSSHRCATALGSFPGDQSTHVISCNLRIPRAVSSVPYDRYARDERRKELVGLDDQKNPQSPKAHYPQLVLKDMVTGTWVADWLDTPGGAEGLGDKLLGPQSPVCS